MSKLAKQRIPFESEGRFLGFLPDKDGKLKYLRWQAGAEVFAGKIPKPLRSELYRSLKPGDRVQIAGEREVNLLKGREKWVLYRVVPVQASPVAAMFSPKAAPGSEEARKGVVLVCQKSDCCRRGAMAVIQALQAHLAAYPETIRVQGVGCMKDCKRGPNVVFLPDKARYSGVSPQGIPALLERHFPIASLQVQQVETAASS
ncbi:(2Fe-2S) ferredoxin domain-containing protein [Synechococcus sp. H55.2]|uniref:(2Fe-2S) ferredoxin domain-containing protein n=1 Tax=Synechococcus sp. H55.2 TaxID=2964505 RepID=UPI0039C4E1DC